MSDGSDYPHPVQFGSGGATSVHPIVLLAVVIVAILVLSLKRKHVIIPLFVAAFLIPMDQVFILGPLHFSMLRIVLAVSWIRLLTAKFGSNEDIFSGGMNWLDKSVIFLTLTAAVDFVISYGQMGALINQLGVIYTSFGGYFVLRFLIRDEEDAIRTIRVFAYVSIAIAAVMVTEQALGHSPYVYLGGGDQSLRISLMERSNRFRAMGSFSHPILAGTFGAISIPLYIGIWLKDKKNLTTALIGVVTATIIIIASVSSTPIMAVMACVLAFCMWPIRRSMRAVRWGIVTVLLTLHLAMKAPVWALISRVDAVGGSSGYHRYMLVDNFIRRFGDWWLVGAKDFDKWGWDMWDLSNQYVAYGETSGVLPFIFFIVMLCSAFRYVGLARQRLELEGNKKQELFIYALGAALFTNAVAFFGISYFDQTMQAWYALLSIISVTAYALIPKADAEPAPISTGVRLGQLAPATSPVVPPGPSRAFSKATAPLVSQRESERQVAAPPGKSLKPTPYRPMRPMELGSAGTKDTNRDRVKVGAPGGLPDPTKP